MVSELDTTAHEDVGPGDSTSVGEGNEVFLTGERIIVKSMATTDNVS